MKDFIGPSDRELMLERLGLRSEALGPPEEWAAVDPATFQKRHAQFWSLVAGIIRDEPEENYDDLPDWMTEVGTEQLEANTHN